MSTSAHREPSSLSRSARPIYAAVLCLTALLSACGGSDDAAAGPGVASLPTTSSASSAAASADAGGAAGGTAAVPVAKGPQIRPDTTEEERLTWTRVYMACLGNAGVTMNPGKPGAFPYPENGAEKQPAWAKAQKTCAAKRPIPPPEEDPATNPHYMDDYRKEIRCLNAGGLKVDALPKGGGWNYSDDYRSGALSDEEEARLTKKCEIEAYSGKS